MGRKIWIAGGILITAVGLTAGYLYMEKDRKKKLDAQKKAIDFDIDPVNQPTMAFKPIGGGSTLYQAKIPSVIAKPVAGTAERRVNFRNYGGPYNPGNFCCDNF